MPLLLPALVRHLYQLSWQPAPLQPALQCAVAVAACDPAAAAALCADLETVAVNSTFDTAVKRFLSEVAAQ